MNNLYLIYLYGWGVTEPIKKTADSFFEAVKIVNEHLKHPTAYYMKTGAKHVDIVHYDPEFDREGSLIATIYLFGESNG